MKVVTFELHEQTYRELEILLEEMQTHGGEWRLPLESVADVIRHVAVTVAEGSARPDSWERQLLYPMGLIPMESELLLYYRRMGSRDIPEQPE
jgi:hypothetical protein